MVIIVICKATMQGKTTGNVNIMNRRCVIMTGAKGHLLKSKVTGFFVCLFFLVLFTCNIETQQTHLLITEALVVH